MQLGQHQTNLGLQSVGVMRKEMPAEAEKAIKNCNSLKQIQSAGDKFRKEIAESVKAPVELLSDIMCSLELNGKKFEVETPCSDDELESFWEILLQIKNHFLLMTLLEIRSEMRLHCRSFFPTVVSYDITPFASSVGKMGGKCVNQ